MWIQIELHASFNIIATPMVEFGRPHLHEINMIMVHDEANIIGIRA